MDKKRKALYPGTFDPVTNGHLDILNRASRMFDEIIVAVGKNPSKSTLFTVEERLDFLKKSVRRHKFHCPIQIEPFNGLIVDFAREKKIMTLIRGLRAVSDFDYELQMALMNRKQASDMETVFLMPDEKFIYLSSSLVKTIGRFGGDLKHFLPKPVITGLKKKFQIWNLTGKTGAAYN